MEKQYVRMTEIKGNTNSIYLMHKQGERKLWKQHKTQKNLSIIDIQFIQYNLLSHITSAHFLFAKERYTLTK
jgi:thiamine kinase-like enzyme